MKSGVNVWGSSAASTVGLSFFFVLLGMSLVSLPLRKQWREAEGKGCIEEIGNNFRLVLRETSIKTRRNTQQIKGFGKGCKGEKLYKLSSV